LPVTLIRNLLESSGIMSAAADVVVCHPLSIWDTDCGSSSRNQLSVRYYLVMLLIMAWAGLKRSQQRTCHRFDRRR
jgi:hypothetical protein